jgi:hypothetical protein
VPRRIREDRDAENSKLASSRQVDDIVITGIAEGHVAPRTAGTQHTFFCGKILDGPQEGRAGPRLHRSGQGAPPRSVSPASVIFAIASAPIARPSASAISLISCTVVGMEEHQPTRLQKGLNSERPPSLDQSVALKDKGRISARFWLRSDLFFRQGQ